MSIQVYIMRKVIYTLIIILFLSRILFSQPNNWISIGGTGNTITRLHFNSAGDTLFVGTIEGYRFYSLHSFNWEIREMTGYIGRTVWAISTVPGFYGRIITGRVNAFFKGYIELNENFSTQGTIVRNSQGGRFTDIKYIPNNPSIIFACGWSDITPGDLVKSTNAGLNWVLLSGYLHTAMTEIAVNPLIPNELYVSGDAKVTKSTNSGETWFNSNNGLPSNLGCYCISINPFNPNILLTSNDSGIYRSTDSGQNWIRVYSSAVCRRFAYHPSILGFVAGITFSPYKVLISTNSGLNWADSTGSFPGNNMVDLAFSNYDNNIYVASSTSGIFKRHYLITNTKGENTALPHKLILHQNYPNPFNNYTIIKFSIPFKNSYSNNLYNVTLKVYDLLGKELLTTLNTKLTSGNYSIRLDALDFNSGIYFYKLTVDEFSEIRKMILIK